MVAGGAGSCCTLVKLLRPMKVAGFRKIRVGGPSDGAYVMLDDFRAIEAALSLGVGPNVDWDYEIADRGIPVHQFDHTVAGPPRQHPGFYFKPRMIRGRKFEDCETVESIMTSIGRYRPASCLLKIDIECWEYPVFRNIAPKVLGRFSQILVELHGFNYLHHDETFVRMFHALTNLTRQFAPIHVHGNNCAGLNWAHGTPIPDVIEVSLVNRERYRVRPSRVTFPTALDLPNRPDTPEYRLGRFAA